MTFSAEFEGAIRPGYASLVAAWQALAVRGDVSLGEVALADGKNSLLYADIRPTAARQVFIAAGVHGDEPVSPWALVSLVRDGLLDTRFGYRIWGCTNPTGFDLGTRNNEAGHDINRSYGTGPRTDESTAIIAATMGASYELAIDMHEDFEGEGFYLYEPVVDDTAPFGRAILNAVEEAGYPIQEFTETYDLGYPLDCAPEVRHLERGRVLPNIECERAYFREGLPLTMFLLEAATKRTLTFETPRRALWDDRIAMHRIAVVTALDTLVTL